MQHAAEPGRQRREDVRVRRSPGPPTPSRRTGGLGRVRSWSASAHVIGRDQRYGGEIGRVHDVRMGLFVVADGVWARTK